MHYMTQSAQIGQHITQIILTSPDPQILLAKIAKTLGECFEVDACIIVPLAQQGDGFVPIGATGQMALWCADDVPTLSLSDSVQLVQQPLLKTYPENDQPQAIEDLQALEAGFTPNEDCDVLPIRAILKIHTEFQSGVNGVILLGRSQPHEWTPPEKALLTIVAQSVAVALSHVQLSRQVHSFAHSQTFLNQLRQAMHNSDTLDDVLQIAITSTGQALQVDQGLVILLTYADSMSTNQPSQQLGQTKVKVVGEWINEIAQLQDSTTESHPSLLNQSFWLSESCLCQQALRDAPAPLLITDSRNCSLIDLKQDNLSIFERRIMPALLIVPLLGTPSNSPVVAPVLGFFLLQQRQPRQWYADELELVKGVSDQLSIAIIQHQTLRQVQSLVDNRTAQLQHTLEIQAQLYERTNQQIDQLQQLNQLKDEFMSSMSHELRTPLTAMSLAIRMLRQPTIPPDRKQKYLEILEEECNKEIELINDLLSLQRLETNQTLNHSQKIDLLALIDRLAESFQEKWAHKQLTLRVENPATSLVVNADADSLSRILLELLTNAGKYSYPGTTIHLKVTHPVQPSDNQVVLKLSNIGAGIFPEDIDHIFDKFRRGQGMTQKAVRGTGLGLALVKCLVQHLNGTIAVSSRPVENSEQYVTSFTLTLPQLQESF